ncbi:hypothetical protein, unlikely [Trypanosoma brucei gambiense DAL972]|uniref:T. brucei spp.-specific protein n=1 Tax=Trypanosoma brucei gambiense (strain MHOM/CI/86/DAL972) TaxID=679716 RepID=C9ZK28_TRYB9|nr:hypothetical protein, unlikely [Trypanosoma brucei gambiense DAL972]CBH09792.1 hypothetical protein, unlikely [Trypanosoma brucei gambiense DAL972]|eukprot:XP_011772085.1 hypothetical protein, unlikely [Trypanosoma brucei gambiense DAL972]
MHLFLFGFLFFFLTEKKNSLTADTPGSSSKWNCEYLLCSLILRFVTFYYGCHYIHITPHISSRSDISDKKVCCFFINHICDRQRSPHVRFYFTCKYNCVRLLVYVYRKSCGIFLFFPPSVSAISFSTDY